MYSFRALRAIDRVKLSVTPGEAGSGFPEITEGSTRDLFRNREHVITLRIGLRGLLGGRGLRGARRRKEGNEFLSAYLVNRRNSIGVRAQFCFPESLAGVFIENMEHPVGSRCEDQQ